MKPYQKIIIRECYEPLVAIPATEFVLEVPPAYVKLGADYGSKSPYYLRKGVLERLLQANRHLQEIKPGWRIKVFDAYRPLSVQKFMVEYVFKSLCREKGLNPDSLDEGTRRALYEQVYQIWAVPSDNPLTPPPHSTGAAVDITLVDEKGELVAMGGEIDDLSPVSHPDYYANATEAPATGYHRNRQILWEIMTVAGFCRHPGEWWHFSHGDQMWAWLTNKPSAIYGRID
ncbi:MAG TPA: M15 family metallopeptidase [Geminocystis sp. M7585_C2015_104]|nr:M15 family metallopeptidase [Geminocystis sp. M7585_C2015_104]